VDARVFPEWSRAEMIALMVDKLDGKMLPGTPHPLQDFVVGEGIKPSDLYKPGLRSGYNIDNGKWIVPPERDRVHDVKAEEGGFYAWGLSMADKMERLLRYEPEQAVRFWHQIHAKRQRDMRAGKGDFAESNVVYKFLANRGLFPPLSEASGEYIAKTASLLDEVEVQPNTGWFNEDGEWKDRYREVQGQQYDTLADKRGPGESRVAYHHGEPIASLTWIDTPDQTLIGTAYTHPNYRGQGIFDHLAQDIRASGKPIDAVRWHNRGLERHVRDWTHEAGKPKKPPHLKDAKSAAKSCLNCTMYHKASGGKGKCWGYGEYDVREDQVCDSYEKETRNLLNKFTKMAAPYDRQVAKFVYDPQANHLLLGQMGREEGENLTHDQLRGHSVWGDGLPPQTTWGTIGQNGYAEAYGGNSYHEGYKTEEALRRTVPGVKIRNPREMLHPEWAIDDPQVTYVGEPPTIKPAEEEDKRWDFQAKVDLTQVAQRIYEGVRNGAGATLNLHGESPHTRYGFAPDLATQTPIPLETFSPKDVLDFIGRFSDRLADPEKFVGSWVQGDQVILDVSEGHDSYDVAHQRAWDGHQLALYDSIAKEDIPVRGLDYEQPALSS